MLREPWWMSHDRHADVVDRRDVELDAAHDLDFAQRAEFWFARGGVANDCA